MKKPLRSFRNGVKEKLKNILTNAGGLRIIKLSKGETGVGG